LIRKIAGLSPGQFKYLNLGGGLGVATVKPYQLSDLIRNTLLRILGKPVTYDLSSRTFDLEKLAGEIIGEVTQFFKKENLSLPSLVFEPGRYVTGDAFVLAAKVVLRKTVPHSGTWLVLDAGTNLFPYLLSFNEYHQIVPMVQKPGPEEVVHLSGPLLYSSDIVMKNALLPFLSAGDLVGILDAGAYTLAYSNQFLYPRPAVVLIDGENVQLIRTAETLEGVLANDRMV
jgi:diaminopimelate decarboxylase